MIKNLLRKIISIALFSVCILLIISCRVEDDTEFKTTYPVASKIGYSSTDLGTVERQHPTVSDEGIFSTATTPRSFPVYGTTSQLSVEEKRLLLEENANLVGNKLSNVSGTYDCMDATGALYSNKVSLSRHLYKHRASEGMYLGNLSDDEPAVIKKVSYQPTRTNGNHITGLYAPAGEVISFTMSIEDMESSGGIQVFIGQALSNGKANNIWLERDFNRMPIIVNALNITKDTYTLKQNQDGTVTGYMGSFLGGPIYIKPLCAGSSFSVTISGGVNYSHFILGYTTEEEFLKNKESSAPYFDLEVWDRGVRHSGPSSQAKDFDYQDLYRAAILWENAMRISSQVPSSSSSGSGIDFIYDCFVAAGAAVAFPAQSTSVNCPISWLYSALDYETIVTQGCWGNLHEMNHHFQSQWGMSNGGEVTNNVVTLIFYSLYTKISSQRDITKVNEGMGGWNRYTSATWSLNQLLSGNRENDLSCYSTILHSFGQNTLIAAAQKKLGSQTDQWFKSLMMSTGYDMTYYFKDICKVDVSQEMLDWAKKQNYPMFVPVALPYQVGLRRNINEEEQSFTSMQPYEIEEKQDFTIDLDKDLVLPDGFTYQVKSISSPQYGQLASINQNKYTYQPDAEHKNSGTFDIVLSIKKEDQAFEVEDIVIQLEFKQKAHQPNILDRVTYQYTEETIPESIDTAIENQFITAEQKNIEDNVYASGQNGNAQVWFPQNNTITELCGKLYLNRNGKYRISLRGREYCSLYLSFDNGSTYDKSVQIDKNENIGSHAAAIENHKYVDFEGEKEQWVYFKIYVMNKNNNNLSFVDLGFGKFNGENVNVAIVNNAYRPSYEKEELFIVEPQYDKVYLDTYTTSYDRGTLVSSKYEAWDNNYKIDNLFDEDTTNFIHSNKTSISSENPFEVNVDLGKETTVNTITIFGEPSRKYNPKSFTLYGGLTMDHLSTLLTVDNAPVQNDKTMLSFETTNIRYYKLVVTDTYADTPKYIAFREIELSLTYDGLQRITPDHNAITYIGDWQKKQGGTYGHAYQAGQEASLQFGFYGTQFAIYSKQNQGIVDIMLDGTAIETIDLSTLENDVTYLSSVLTDTYHTVELVTKDGEFEFDSISLKLSKPFGSEQPSGIQNIEVDDDGSVMSKLILVGAIVLSAGLVILVSVLVLKTKKEN